MPKHTTIYPLKPNCPSHEKVEATCLPPQERVKTRIFPDVVIQAACHSPPLTTGIGLEPFEWNPCKDGPHGLTPDWLFGDWVFWLWYFSNNWLNLTKFDKFDPAVWIKNIWDENFSLLTFLNSAPSTISKLRFVLKRNEKCGFWKSFGQKNLKRCGFFTNWKFLLA